MKANVDPNGNIPHHSAPPERRGKTVDRLGPLSQARQGAFETPPLELSGTVNFAMICVILYSLNKIANNYYESGIFVDWTLLLWLIDDWPIGVATHIAMFLWCVIMMYPLVTFTVQKRIPYSVGLALYIIAQSTLWTIPIIIAFQRDFSPVMGMVTSMQIAVHSMKIHSYWATSWLLAATEQKENKQPKMPLKQFLYFLVAPTLIFEPFYPRTKRINWGYLVSLAIQTISTTFVVYLVINEDIIPIYRNALHLPIHLAVLRLAIPSFMIWLLMFYLLFHCILGMIAEVTLFADREFYLDWWNANTFGTWWKKWNRPVHRWMLRHIYHDSMHTMQYDKDIAVLATFALSALVHEFVLAVAFKMIRPILFVTIILQIGLIYFTNLSFVNGSRIGNLAMWMCLILGQPAIEILYCREYLLQHEAEAFHPAT